jgi:NitT/TauT family transport system substrate-binding protein
MLAGEAELATTAETPIVLAALDGHADAIAVLATLAQSTRGLAVIARADRGIERPPDLAGRSIGVTPKTNVEYFLDLFLTLHGLGPADVRLVPTAPEDLVGRALDGSLDAVATFEPHTARLLEALGRRARPFREPHIYTWLWNLCGRTDFVGRSPAAARAVLAAALEATGLVDDAPEAARAAMRPILGPLPKGSWDHIDFTMSLDQALVPKLENQADWALESRRRAAPAEPWGVLRMMRPGPLRSVDPHRVTLISGGA